MAVWQCDIRLIPRDARPASTSASGLTGAWAGADLVESYRDRLSEAGASRAASWSPRLEMWGSQEGDRVDVFRSKEGAVSSVLVRFDMRRPRRRFIEAVADVASANSCVGIDESGQRVEATVEAFVAAMRASRAARFVEDPRAFLDDLAAHGGYDDKPE